MLQINIIYKPGRVVYYAVRKGVGTLAKIWNWETSQFEDVALDPYCQIYTTEAAESDCYPGLYLDAINLPAGDYFIYSYEQTSDVPDPANDIIIDGVDVSYDGTDEITPTRLLAQSADTADTLVSYLSTNKKLATALREIHEIYQRKTNNRIAK